MSRKPITFVCLLTAMTLIFTGCSMVPKKEVVEDTRPLEEKYIDDLEDGKYYIRHTDYTCEQPYFGTGTFSQGSISSNASRERILWYKYDFQNIPTMYKDDSLIMYTTGVLNESVYFERFVDLGYTIGLCGLSYMPSGRVCVGTKKNTIKTYPGGDTDEFLYFNNDTVIIETLGGVKLRKENTDKYLTEYGTIKGLEYAQQYAAEVYEGSIRHEMTFVSDIRVLASSEVIHTLSYEFEGGKLIRITLPKGLKSGYYLLNGVGIFRYVNDTTYDETMDMNEPNDDDETKEDPIVDYVTGFEEVIEAETGTIPNEDEYEVHGGGEDVAAQRLEDIIAEVERSRAHASIEEPGIKTAFVKVSKKDGATSDVSGITILMQLPGDRGFYELDKDSSGIFYYQFLAKQAGSVQFTAYGLAEDDIIEAYLED